MATKNNETKNTAKNEATEESVTVSERIAQAREGRAMSAAETSIKLAAYVGGLVSFVTLAVAGVQKVTNLYGSDEDSMEMAGAVDDADTL